MKFSKTLLENKEIKERIFENGVEKANELIEYIFGSEALLSLQNVIKDDKNEDLFIMKYGANFNYNDRDIYFLYVICECEEDTSLLEEVINIMEFNTKQIKLNISSDSFKNSISEIKNYLEKQYKLDFTPLNLDIKDKNILDVNVDEEAKEWITVFNQEDFEGKYIATFSFKDSILEIKKIKEHKVILD